MIMTDIDIFDYELSYGMMIAEQEMFESLIDAELEFTLADEIDSQILTEGVKETVMKYLNKVVVQLQAVWVKFNKNISSKLAGGIAKGIQEKIAKNKDNIGFFVNYYGEMDLDKMANYQVKPWSLQDYEQHKQDYDTKEAYIKANYPDLVPNDQNKGRDLKKCIIDNIVDQHNGYHIDANILTGMVEFLTKDYRTYVETIEKDIEAINASCTNISNAVNTVMSAETPANESFAFLESVYLDLFTEAEEPENAGKMSFTDDSGEKSGDTSSDDGNKDEAKEQDKARSQFTKHTSTYMSVSIGLISAKMSIVNRAATDRLKILMHFNNSIKGNSTAVIKGKPGEAAATTNVPQVNTNATK